LEIELVVPTVLTTIKGTHVMTNTRTTKTDPDEPLVYQIRIKGHLSRHWSDWFGGLTITALDNGETLLTGAVVDQAALHGLLKKVRDIGLPLVSVECVKAGPTQAESLEVNEAHQAHSEEEI
jgi:hypothetical protein